MPLSMSARSCNKSATAARWARRVGLPDGPADHVLRCPGGDKGGFCAHRNGTPLFAVTAFCLILSAFSYIRNRFEPLDSTLMECLPLTVPGWIKPVAIGRRVMWQGGVLFCRIGVLAKSMSNTFPRSERVKTNPRSIDAFGVRFPVVLPVESCGFDI